MAPTASSHRLTAILTLTAITILSASSIVVGRTPPPLDTRPSITMATGRPATCATTHRIGKIALTISNYGTLGTYYLQGARWTLDCFTGERTVSCEYPRNSGTEFLFGGAVWLGGIVGKDTLVSTGSDGWGMTVKHALDLTPPWQHRGMEWAPDEAPFGDIKRRSTLNPMSEAFRNAISEEDLIVTYTDTFPNGHRGLVWDAFEGRSHIPLRVEIEQTSYAWSYPYAESMILFRLDLKNIGDQVINEAYLGMLIDGDVYNDDRKQEGAEDDITGFFKEVTTRYQGCDFTDTVNLAWIADNDGDFTKGTPAKGVIGTSFLNAPYQSHTHPAYNWWSSSNIWYYDFGPRRIGTEDMPFRDFRTGGLGTPEGDCNKYYIMASGEVDYDQVRTAQIPPEGSEWLHPGWWRAYRFFRGNDVRYLHSVGPFNLIPDHSTSLVFAFVASENFHTSHMNFRENMQPTSYDPDAFYEGLGVADLGTKALWADWVYDNPGIDTDDDGYRGRFRLCCQDSVIADIDSIGAIIDTIWLHDVCDTVWYKGDGVPDWVAATAPPAPVIWVETYSGYIRIRWNGLNSETTPDMFTRVVDFDGYRVYMGRDDRPQSFTLMASYDLENYVKYVYNRRLGFFEPLGDPLTREEVICLYGQSCDDDEFEPRLHDQGSPILYMDSLIYFRPQDYNRSELGVTTPIVKIYPDAPKPVNRDPDAVPDSLKDIYLTEDGYFKYYEYEYTVENILPTVSYFVNISAFDVGSPAAGLDALESPKHINAIEAYPQPSHDEVEAKDLKVYVYPNPYRIDGDYLESGYEGRNAQYYIPERLRLIHFANLPPKCWIRIFSLDGDLIRELRHDKDPEDPTSTHDTWDMITRNTQALVSGLYYWTVEDDAGRVQIGKLVILK